jgi:hypothetical protein
MNALIARIKKGKIGPWQRVLVGSQLIFSGLLGVPIVSGSRGATYMMARMYVWARSMRRIDT